MKTRSKYSLSEIHIRDLLLSHKKFADKTAVDDHVHSVTHTPALVPVQVLTPVPELVVPVVSVVPVVPVASTHHTPKVHMNTYKICVLDTEAFTGVPIQVAWNIYEINETLRSLTLVSKHMCYISEMWVLSSSRQSLKENKYFTEKTLERHELHLQVTGFPLKSASSFLQDLQNSLGECEYVAAFNFSWDFEAIAGLISKFNVCTPNGTLMTNPLGSCKPLCIMEMVYAAFDIELIVSGVTDGIIDTMGRKRNDQRKSIYNADYMAKVLLHQQFPQKHIADDDVIMEASLIEKCLQKTGSVIYPKCVQDIWKTGQAKTQELYPVLPSKCVSCNDPIPQMWTQCQFCFDTHRVLSATAE